MDRDLSRSRAILISNATYDDERILDLPAASGCASAMAGLLTSDLCGWPAERVERWVNVPAPHDLARKIVDAVKDVQDVLLLYYVGHGIRTVTGQLALALRGTSADPELVPDTATSYERVAQILRGCPAATKLVVLDCCHAELANKANYQFQSADIDGEPVDGLYFIGASKQWEKARSPLAGDLTYFTEAFIEVVRTGIPRKPSWLTIDQIFTELRARMLRAGLPEPVQSGIRDAHHWSFARNAARQETHHDPDQMIALLTQRLAESDGLRTAAAAQIQALKAEAEERRREPAAGQNRSSRGQGTARSGLFAGRYELDGVIGRGRRGEVYRAYDTLLDRTLAIKTLRTDLARYQTFQARFRSEARSASSLNHPSIVAVHDYGEEVSGRVPVPYVVMEYVDGRTARDLIQADYRLWPERSLEIIDGVLRALEYGHQAGVVHRDIKPGNVMVTRKGEIKVMNFGFAWTMSDAQATLTQTTQFIGTAHYLSPEQVRGDRADARSDLYSVGCLLYELLTGRPPFSGDHPMTIAYQHVGEDPIPPSGLDPEISPRADEVVLKAMAKEPADRYQSAADMRTDLQFAAQDIAAESASPENRPDQADAEEATASPSMPRPAAEPEPPEARIVRQQPRWHWRSKRSEPR